MENLNNFVVLDSVYGRFLINRHCDFQSEALLKTGRTHIESELANIFAIVDRLDDRCIIVDGGANAGFFTVPVARRVKSKQGIVISFEPQREIFNGLAGTVALNDLTNVRLNRMGLSDEFGAGSLPEVDYSVKQDFGTLKLERNEKCANMYELLVDQSIVETIRLDDINLPRLDFYKLDVEGFEIHALRGSAVSINRHRPFLWVEYWMVGLDALQRELAGLNNYQMYVIDALNALWAPKEKLLKYGIDVISS